MHSDNADDLKKLIKQGFHYATIDTYSSDKMKIRSKHKTLAAAERAAKNTNRTIAFLNH